MYSFVTSFDTISLTALSLLLFRLSPHLSLSSPSLAQSLFSVAYKMDTGTQISNMHRLAYNFDSSEFLHARASLSTGPQCRLRAVLTMQMVDNYTHRFIYSSCFHRLRALSRLRSKVYIYRYNRIYI